MNTPRTGDDAGLIRNVATAIEQADIKSDDCDWNASARAAIAAVRSWDEANAGSVPVAGLSAGARKLILRLLVKESASAMEDYEDGEASDSPDYMLAHRDFCAAEDAIVELSALGNPVPPAPGEAAAPVQGTAGRELAGELAFLIRAIDGGHNLGAAAIADVLAARLAERWTITPRDGAPSQATGGGCRGRRCAPPPSYV